MVDNALPEKHESFVDQESCLEVIKEIESKLGACQLTSIECAELNPATNVQSPEIQEQRFKQLVIAENLVQKFQKLIDPYQEQPELLEPYLSALIEELTSGITNSSNISTSDVKYHTTFKFLYQLIKVTGFKSIGKKFPHDTSKLPLLVDLLSRENCNDKLNWQTRYVLTVWLSIVILIPFDLEKFKQSVSDENASTSTSLKGKIYTTLYGSLQQHDSCQHVTSYCLAKFFSRSDILSSSGIGSSSSSSSSSQCKLHTNSDVEGGNNETSSNCSCSLVDKFINETMLELKNVKLGSGASSLEDVKLIGHLRTLSYMYKFLPRHEMKLRSEKILNSLTKFDVDKTNRELINHIIIKLIQRAGLALLPNPLSTSWRYKRGSRILNASIKISNNSTGSASIMDVDTGIEASSLKQLLPEEQKHKQQNNEEEIGSAEHLESVLSVLFVACQNSQTRIRWSAAKGIARLSSRLSRERASDVIGMILGNFFDLTKSNEFAWHGGCLTLAEMSRNGLILEEKLEQVIEIISNAIIYDKIKGSFAVGSHIREAACYVCWAMARSYEDYLLAPYIPSISINLLCTVLFDRELQCRRAASATFQELVGRQGTFNEEGINILNQLDYQNVGQRQQTYLKLAHKVVSYNRERYLIPFIEHLLDKKVGHWDIQIRRLASESLATLMTYLNYDENENENYVDKRVIPRLMEMIEQNLDNNAKHGAILALSKLIRELTTNEMVVKEFSQELIDFMGSIVGLCDKQLKSKQQAGNFIEAIGYVIECCEAASFDYPEEEGGDSEKVVPEAEVAEDLVAKPSTTMKDVASISGSRSGINKAKGTAAVTQAKVSVIKQWESVALRALDSDDSHLRDIGSNALLTLYKTYYKRNKACQDRLLTTLNKSLNSLNESSRCGGLRALSKLSQVSDSYFELGVSADSAASSTGIKQQQQQQHHQDHDTCSITSQEAATTNSNLMEKKTIIDTTTATTAIAAETGSVIKSKIRLDSDTPNIILMSITGYIAKETHERKDNLVFAQAKAEACEALVNFVCSLDKVRILPLLNLIRAAYDALLEKTEDYTLDKRGDIGVVVRQAAIKALLALTIHLQSINLTSLMFEHDNRPQTSSIYHQQSPITLSPSLSSSASVLSAHTYSQMSSSSNDEIDNDFKQFLKQDNRDDKRRNCCLIQRIITKFLQQSVSYHNSLRELASRAVYKLVTMTSLQDKLIPRRAYILSLFEKFNVKSEEEFNWRDESIPIFVSLLSCQEYNLDLWIGLVPSVGQASDLSAKPFKEALANYIRSLSSNIEGGGSSGGIATEHDNNDEISSSNSNLSPQYGYSASDTASGSGSNVFVGAVAPAATHRNVSELEIVFNAFMECLESTKRTGSGTLGERHLTSAFTTADYLLSYGLMNETSGQFQERLANFCWQARLSPAPVSSNNSTTTTTPIQSNNNNNNNNNKPDPKRLISVARVLSSMLQLPGQVQITCLKYCLQLLVNGFSRVRVCTAEQFYLSVMTYESELRENLTRRIVLPSSSHSSALNATSEQKGCQMDSAELKEANAEASAEDEDGLALGGARARGSRGGSVSGSNGGGEEDLATAVGGRGSSSAGKCGITIITTPDAATGEQGAEEEGGVDLEQAMELLNQTDWTEPLEKLRPVRDQISACFGLSSCS